MNSLVTITASSSGILNTDALVTTKWSVDVDNADVGRDFSLSRVLFTVTSAGGYHVELGILLERLVACDLSFQLGNSIFATNTSVVSHFNGQNVADKWSCLPCGFVVNRSKIPCERIVGVVTALVGPLDCSLGSFLFWNAARVVTKISIHLAEPLFFVFRRKLTFGKNASLSTTIARFADGVPIELLKFFTREYAFREEAVKKAL